MEGGGWLYGRKDGWRDILMSECREGGIKDIWWMDE